MDELRLEIQRMVACHVAAALENDREPFAGLSPAPERYWDMFRRAKVALPSERFTIEATSPISVDPPEIRVKTAAAWPPVLPYSQRPTLGEFILRAKHYGWVRYLTGEIGGSFGRRRLQYLRRESLSVEIVELPSHSDHIHLTRHGVETLCRKTGIPLDDFLPGEDDSGD